MDGSPVENLQPEILAQLQKLKTLVLKGKITEKKIRFETKTFMPHL